MREFKLFICETCKTAYTSEELAKKCEARGAEELKVKVGDMVWLDLSLTGKRLYYPPPEPKKRYMRVQVVGIDNKLYSTPPRSGLGGIIRCWDLVWEGINKVSSSLDEGPHVYSIQVRLKEYSDKPIPEFYIARCPLEGELMDNYLQSELVLEKPVEEEALPEPVEIVKPEALSPEVKNDVSMKKGFFARLFRR